MIDGALCIDKPAGMSSHSVIAKLRGILKQKKLGHAGTLDPDATGLLVVLCGRATRVQDFLLQSEKEYIGEIVLGLRTTTDDISGEILQSDEHLAFWQQYDPEGLCAALREQFSGIQLQVPPQISAVQVDGKRSYKLARKGKGVELAPREVAIEFLALESISRTELRYHIRCSKGTYVRALARDIGSFLNSCAAVKSIRRVRAGAFELSQALELDSISQMDPEEIAARLLPIESLVSELPKLSFDETQCLALFEGRQECLKVVPEAEAEGKFVAVFSEKGRVAAVIKSVVTGGWEIRCTFPE
jgi:tRNA pseudouridine55 synthase